MFHLYSIYSAFSFAHRAARCRKEDERSIKTLGVWFLCWSRIQENSAWNVPSVPIHITIQVPRSELAKAASSLLNSCRSRENGGLERYGLGLAIPLLQVHWVGFITDVLHISSVLIFVMFCSHLISIYLSIYPSLKPILSIPLILSICPICAICPISAILSYLFDPSYPSFLSYLSSMSEFVFYLILSILSYITIPSIPAYRMYPINLLTYQCYLTYLSYLSYLLYRVYRISYPVCPIWPPLASISLQTCST